MEPPDVVRPLGHLEMYASSRHSLGLYRVLANACQYVVPADTLGSRSPEVLVENALARLVLRLGSLQVGIVREDTNKPCFVRLPSVSLKEMIDWTTAEAGDGGDEEDDDSLLRVLEDHQTRLWPDMHVRPPWKLIVRDHARSRRGGEDELAVIDIVFAAHHAIADGKSQTLVHKMLLEELNRGSEPPPELQSHVLTLHSRPVVAPPQHELVPYSISWAFMLKSLWAEFAPAWLRGAAPATPWTGKPITLSPHKLHLRLVAVRAAAVPPLLAACRARATTLTGLLHALVLCSVARRLPPGDAPAFNAATAISMLPFARLPAGAAADLDLRAVLTDLNTGLGHSFAPDLVAAIRAAGAGADDEERGRGQEEGREEELVWGVARRVRGELQQRVATLPRDDVTGMLAWVGDWRRRWLGLVGKPREDSWAVSNVGSPRYEAARAAGWRVRRSFFAQPAMVVGPAFGVNVTGVQGGDVTMTLNWQESVVEDGVMEGLAADLKLWFGRFADTGRFGVFGA